MKKILLVGLFLIAFLGRTFFHFGPNWELVTTAMVLSAYYFGQKTSFWLTLVILVSTDLILGNTNIFLFTWSGFLIPALVLNKIFPKIIKIFKYKSISGALLGFGSNLFFYFWTNFGVWFLDSWGMYPKTFAGFVQCYINGLPFLRPQIVSSLIFIPLGFIIIELSKSLRGCVEGSGRKSHAVPQL
jgi:hypothetical protein